MRLAPLARGTRFALLATAIATLVLAVSGGLVRLGAAGALLDAHAVAWHGALMIGGFLGTVIGLERAVALRAPPGYLAPIASAAGALAILTGHAGPGAWLMVFGACGLAVVSVVLVHRQRAAHTVLLALAALALALGDLLFALDWPIDAARSWWFDFLLLTIAAERLELTRLTRRGPLAQPLLFGVAAALALSSTIATAGVSTAAFWHGGAQLTAAAWLLVYDIARRTIRANGLPRYMAICLLSGYGWLAVAGAAEALGALGIVQARDTALHAFALGFVMSMIFGHAPVILPAVTGVRLDFGARFYAPLALLHGSLALRFAGDVAQAPVLRLVGGWLNAASIALFVATIAGTVLAKRLRAN